MHLADDIFLQLFKRFRPLICCWIFSGDRCTISGSLVFGLIRNFSWAKNILKQISSIITQSVSRKILIRGTPWLTREGELWGVYCEFKVLTHWGQDKMAAIFQTRFSNAFSWMKMFEFLLKFHSSLFPRVQLTVFQHWFRQWLGADQATSHYLHQWWLDFWRIYASLSLQLAGTVLVCC